MNKHLCLLANVPVCCDRLSAGAIDVPDLRAPKRLHRRPLHWTLKCSESGHQSHRNTADVCVPPVPAQNARKLEARFEMCSRAAGWSTVRQCDAPIITLKSLKRRSGACACQSVFGSAMGDAPLCTRYNVTINRLRWD